MGYMRHHAICVTSWDGDRLAEAHQQARNLCGELVSPIIPGNINGEHSFFVAPDGSKEGWSTSDEGDLNRAALIDFMRQERYAGGYLDWVEVQYGDDERETRIIASSDDDQRAVAR
jgi:hypothetical protein